MHAYHSPPELHWVSTTCKVTIVVISCQIASHSVTNEPFLSITTNALFSIRLLFLAGALLGIAVVGVVGACARWGIPGGLAIAASCTWFASPAVAVGLMALMLGSIKKAGVKVQQLLSSWFQVTYDSHELKQCCSFLELLGLLLLYPSLIIAALRSMRAWRCFAESLSKPATRSIFMKPCRQMHL